MADNGDTLSLADRFNSMTLNVTPSVTWEISDIVTATGYFTWQLRDYVEDYDAYADVYSLDQNNKEYGLELEWDATNDLRVTGSAKYTDKQYDEKFSRDASSILVPDVAANYVKTSGEISIDWGERYGPRLGGKFKSYQNTDQYDGYWDYSGMALEADGGWRWEEGHSFDLKIRRSESDYDLSHVLNDPTQPLRSKTVLNVRVSCEYRLRPNLDLVGSFHYKDYDYNSRTFAYTRALMQAGVAYGF